MSARTCSSVSALLLELRLVALVAAAEVLLLDLREPVVDLLVRHVDVELLGLLLELGTLDEELHGLVLERRVLGRARPSGTTRFWAL